MCNSGYVSNKLLKYPFQLFLLCRKSWYIYTMYKDIIHTYSTINIHTWSVHICCPYLTEHTTHPVWDYQKTEYTTYPVWGYRHHYLEPSTLVTPNCCQTFQSPSYVVHCWHLQRRQSPVSNNYSFIRLYGSDSIERDQKLLLSYNCILRRGCSAQALRRFEIWTFSVFNFAQKLVTKFLAEFWYLWRSTVRGKNLQCKNKQKTRNN